MARSESDLLPARPAAPSTVAAVPTAPEAANVGDASSRSSRPDRTIAPAQSSERAQPDYRRNPKPAYPLAARRRRQEGLVLLSVKVSEEGIAARVTLKQSSGFRLLDEAALETVRDWEFEPARIGEFAVESEIEVPVRFQMGN